MEHFITASRDSVIALAGTISERMFTNHPTVKTLSKAMKKHGLFSKDAPVVMNCLKTMKCVGKTSTHNVYFHPNLGVEYRATRIMRKLFNFNEKWKQEQDWLQLQDRKWLRIRKIQVRWKRFLCSILLKLIAQFRIVTKCVRIGKGLIMRGCLPPPLINLSQSFQKSQKINPFINPQKSNFY